MRDLFFLSHPPITQYSLLITHHSLLITFFYICVHLSCCMNNNPHLWQNFLRGDKSALSEIFLSVHDDLFRYGLKLTGDENLVKDAIQDLFLKLWKNRSNLKPIRERTGQTSNRFGLKKKVLFTSTALLMWLDT